MKSLLSVFLLLALLMTGTTAKAVDQLALALDKICFDPQIKPARYLKMSDADCRKDVETHMRSEKLLTFLRHLCGETDISCLRRVYSALPSWISPRDNSLFTIEVVCEYPSESKPALERCYKEAYAYRFNQWRKNPKRVTKEEISDLTSYLYNWKQFSDFCEPSIQGFSYSTCMDRYSKVFLTQQPLMIGYNICSSDLLRSDADRLECFKNALYIAKDDKLIAARRECGNGDFRIDWDKQRIYRDKSGVYHCVRAAYIKRLDELGLVKAPPAKRPSRVF